MIDRTLVIEEFKAHLMGVTIVRNVFRALMLTVVIAATSIDLSYGRAYPLLAAVLLLTALWFQEVNYLQGLLRELRQVLISRRVRESEEELYDDYIRYRHYSGEDTFLSVEPALWAILGAAVLTMRLFKWPA